MWDQQSPCGIIRSGTRKNAVHVIYTMVFHSCDKANYKSPLRVLKDIARTLMQTKVDGHFRGNHLQCGLYHTWGVRTMKATINMSGVVCAIQLFHAITQANPAWFHFHSPKNLLERKTEHRCGNDARWDKSASPWRTIDSYNYNPRPAHMTYLDRDLILHCRWSRHWLFSMSREHIFATFGLV